MLDTLLAFLKDPANKAVLGWIGGGIAAVAAAAWTVFKFFASKDAGVTAKTGSVAVGGDNTQSPITINTHPPRDC